ncbi:MAG: hypothetical protein JSW27_21015 [Phycisphaerales bacterium]|nr:MAG: hypothetical protein JSW27_21015 [Phycisphaerales bacterium]
MKTLTMLAFCSLALVLAGLPVLHAQCTVEKDCILGRTFDLGAGRSAEVQYFVMTSKLINYALDGTRLGTDTMRIHLKCVPAGVSGRQADQYTCAKFTIEFAGSPEVEVPALRNWTYDFGPLMTGIDEKGQVFGIDHAKFENLVDANGKPISPDKSYHVYNAFIDFHGFCNAFACPMPGEGKGIEDLKRIGDRIVHAAAFSEPPVNLGSNVGEGSTFKNGEVTLALKGLSAVDGRACAIVAYDSGASSFQMKMKPMPNMEIQSVGSSHYQGDLYVDLATRWVRKATMYELVVTETRLPMPPDKINSVIERDIVIRNVTEQEFQAR